MRSIPVPSLISFALLALGLGCGGGADLVVTGSGVSVVVDPASVILPPGGAQGFSARVAGATNHSVTWAVAGGTTNGAFTGLTGVYTAPSVPGQYTVVAASAADPGISGMATVLVANPVSVQVDPHTVNLKPLQSRTFTATVTGSPNKTVTWSVVESAGGAFTGTTGLYTAPAAPGVFTVVARSQADPSRFDAATVTVGDAIRVAVSPYPASLVPGGKVTFKATVTGTANTGVDWSIDQPAGGCTIDASGNFTASAIPGAFTVRATSQADHNISGTSTAVVANVTLSLDLHSAVLDQGQTLVFTPTVGGTINQSVTWRNLNANKDLATQTGPYGFTAPASAGPYLLQAVAVANPLVTDQATITINPVVVSLSPSGGSVLATGGALPFTATVTGAVDKTVTWSVLKGGAGGTVNAAGVYIAPAVFGTDTVQAVSNADPAVSASAMVTMGSVVITPASPTALHTGQTAIFSAAVTGVPDPGVEWSVRVGATDVLPAPITATGLFTAPIALGVYRIRATSVVNPALFGEVQITVN